MNPKTYKIKEYKDIVDDTKTCASHRLLCQVIKMLEEDAKQVLMFMASNGLVANPKKTAFMILNHKSDLETTPISINIGSDIGRKKCQITWCCPGL